MWLWHQRNRWLSSFISICLQFSGFAFFFIIYIIFGRPQHFYNSKVELHTVRYSKRSLPSILITRLYPPLPLQVTILVWVSLVGKPFAKFSHTFCCPCFYSVVSSDKLLIRFPIILISDLSILSFMVITSFVLCKKRLSAPKQCRY